MVFWSQSLGFKFSDPWRQAVRRGNPMRDPLVQNISRLFGFVLLYVVMPYFWIGSRYKEALLAAFASLVLLILPELFDFEKLTKKVADELNWGRLRGAASVENLKERASDRIAELSNMLSQVECQAGRGKSRADLAQRGKLVRAYTLFSTLGLITDPNY